VWYQDTYKHSKLRLALLRPSAYIRLSHLHVSLPSLSDRCFRVSSMPARLSKVWRRLRMAVTSCLRPSHAVEEICPKNHPTSPPRSSKHKVHTEGEDGSHTLVASSPRDSAVPPKDLLLPDTPHVDLLNPARQPRLLTPPLPSRSERAYVNVHSLHLGDIRPYGSTGELWEPHESVLANPTSMITNLECASFAGSSRNCELHVGWNTNDSCTRHHAKFERHTTRCKIRQIRLPCRAIRTVSQTVSYPNKSPIFSKAQMSCRPQQ